MALFEFEQGRLIPAQFGHPVDQGLEPDILEAIRTQVLEVIERPLFPVSWHNNGEIDQYRLTALDASGQVVTVELLSRLDPVSLISALSRLGDIAALGWMELASRYPGGPEAFRSGWAEFRESMPPHTEPGPRLILVVGEIDDAVRPALSVLFQSGLEIHEVHLREMSNGRRFLEVMQVRAEVAGLSRQLGQRSSSPAQLTWEAFNDTHTSDSTIVEGETQESASEMVNDDKDMAESQLQDQDDIHEEASPEDGVSGEGEPEVEREQSSRQDEHDNLEDTIIAPVTGAPPPPDVIESDDNDDHEEPVADTHEIPTDSAPVESTQTDSEPANRADDAESEMKRRKPEHVAEREPIPGIIGLNAEGLYAIAQVIGQNARLLWNDGATIFEATLNVDGTIDCGNGFMTTDVEESLLKVTGRGDLIAWKSWRIGHEDGPTLAEAIDEINAEIYRETMAAQQRHSSGNN